MPDKIRFGARGSTLALKQAELAASALMRIGVKAEIVPINSHGDTNLTSPLYKMEKPGVFVDSINRMLLSGEIDAAVHSAKDIPSSIDDGLTVSAVLERESPEDCLASRSGLGIQQLPANAIIGTSSLRRKYDALEVRPDLIVKDIRGNVDTRIGKMLNGDYDAVILAEAGMRRLGLGVRRVSLPLREFIPSPNQGIIAIMTAIRTPHTGLIAKIDHGDTRVAYRYERKASETLVVGCSRPAGILCIPGKNECSIMVRIRSDDGSRKVELFEHFSSDSEFDSILERLKSAVSALR